MSRKKNTGRIECSNNANATEADDQSEFNRFYKKNKHALDAIKTSIAGSDMDTLILWVGELEDLTQHVRDLLFLCALEECASYGDNDSPV